MIYVTGDTHSDFQRFSTRIFPEQKDMSKDDYMIICGDFGGVLSADPDDRTEKYWMDWLEGKNFTTLFIDGNHENFERLDAMPAVSWHGGKVHRLRPTILHLMRGQIYEIGGISFFTFGGARSHDIKDGILQRDDPRLKSRRWRDGTKDFRIDHVNWWQHELPNADEMEEARKNLQAAHWKVDHILTHCMPTSLHLLAGKMIAEREEKHRRDLERFARPISADPFQKKETGQGTEGESCILRDEEPAIRNEFVRDSLTDFLEMIRDKCCYRTWFCGHYHMDHNFTAKEKVLYRQMIRIA